MEQCYTTVENIKWEDVIWVRGSPSVEKLFTARNQVMQYQVFVTLLETTQLKVVRDCRNWIPFHRLEVLLCLRRRINALIPDLKRKDPFSVRIFERTLHRVQLYFDYLIIHKSNWIGLRFHFPIILCPLVDGEDNGFFNTVSE